MLWARTGKYKGSPIQIVLAAALMILKLPLSQSLGLLHSVGTSLVNDEYYSRIEEWVPRAGTLKDIQRHCMKYSGGDSLAGMACVSVSIVLHIACWYYLKHVVDVLLSESFLYVKFLNLVAWFFVRCGTTIRWTALYHDCMHNSLFASSAANNVVGDFIG
jgi:hypothetical protein